MTLATIYDLGNYQMRRNNLDGEITLEECEKSFKMGNHPVMMDIQLCSTSNFSVSYVRIW